VFHLMIAGRLTGRQINSGTRRRSVTKKGPVTANSETCRFRI